MTPIPMQSIGTDTNPGNEGLTWNGSDSRSLTNCLLRNNSRKLNRSSCRYFESILEVFLRDEIILLANEKNRNGREGEKDGVKFFHYDLAKCTAMAFRVRNLPPVFTRTQLGT